MKKILIFTLVAVLFSTIESCGKCDDDHILDMKCSGNTVVKCRHNIDVGYVWEPQQTCPYGCESATATCKPKPYCNHEPDSVVNLTWSSKIGPKTWKKAVEYCRDLTSSSGYNDWRLPNIDALRTLIQNCPNTSTGGQCLVSSGCLSDDFLTYECETCGSANSAISKLDDDEVFWSSSEAKSGKAWTVDFSTGEIDKHSSSKSYFFRCVRTKKDSDNSSGGNSKPVKGDTRITKCSKLPGNATWNTVSSIVQTYDGSDWKPSAETVHNDKPSEEECRFKCIDNYFWSGSKCVLNPCESDPCDGLDHSTGNCSVSDDAGYICECEDGFTWNKTSCEIVCDKSDTTPCKDAETDFMWSAKSTSVKTWDEAKNYCADLEKGGYSDWRFPTIDELRSLIDGCSNTKSGGKCKVSATNGCLSSKDCWDSSCNSCGQTNAATISKFGDSDIFWSSSVRSDRDDSAWYVDFSDGKIHNEVKSNSYYVRCVR